MLLRKSYWLVSRITVTLEISSQCKEEKTHQQRQYLLCIPDAVADMLFLHDLALCW